MIDEQFPLKFLAVAVLLGVLAALRFDRPSRARTFTTRTRFALAGAIYVGVYVFTLVVVFVIVKEFVRSLGRMPLEGVAPLTFSLAVALVVTVAALALTAVEAPLRRAIHALGGIPGYAESLAARLTVADFRPSQDVEDKARDLLGSRGIDVDVAWLDEARPAQRQILRAAAIHLQLSGWQYDPSKKPFLIRVEGEVEQLKQRFDRLSMRAGRMFGCVEQVGEIGLTVSEALPPASIRASGVDVACRKLARDLLADLYSDAGYYFSDACGLVARGVVTVEANAKRRRELIAQCGFKLEHRTFFAMYAALAVAACMLLLGVLAWFAIFGSGADALIIAAVVPLSQTGALAFGSLPKKRWGFANAGLHRSAPVKFVLGAGLAALLWIVLVDVVIGMYVGGWSGVIERMKDGYDYFVAPPATAMATAWLVQDYRWGEATPARRKRVYDALTMGSVWVVTTLIGSWVKHAPHLPSLDPELLQGCAGALMLGAGIGALVPGFFRDASPKACSVPTDHDRVPVARPSM